MNIELLLGLATTGAQTAQPSPLLQFLPIILILFVFYFLVIRPQQKEQKKREEFVDNLKAGV